MGAALLIGLIGIALDQFLLRPLGFSTAWPLAIASFLLALLPLLPPSIRRVSIPAVALMAGIGWPSWRSPTPPDPGPFLARDLIIEGRVDGLPRPLDHGVRFPFRVERGENGLPDHLLLSWYGHPPQLHAGERYRFTVRLRPLRPSRPREVRGYVVARAGFSALGQTGGLHALRQDLAEALARHLDDHPARGVILALSLGIRDAIDDDQWRVLLASGTNHLVAVSGLHIGLVAGLTLWIVTGLWRWSGLAGWLAAPHVGAAAALLAALGYSALAGFSLPTQRALIMLAIGLGAPLLANRHPPVSRTLLLTACVVVAWDPEVLMDPAAWLSFIAVAALLYGLSGARPSGRWSGLMQWGRAQWSLTVGLAPILLILFGQLALFSPLANLPAVPWTGMVVVPLALTATLAQCLGLDDLAALLIRGAAETWRLLWPILEAAAQGGLLHRPSPPSWAWLAAVPGVLWLLAPRGLPARWLGVLWLAPLFAAPLPRPETGAFHFILWEAGDGLAAAIETRHHLLVYDSGTEGDGRALGRWLRRRGWTRVDRLILSHDDSRHTAGARPLVALLPATAVTVGEPGAWTGTATPCREGMNWTWDGVPFRLHHPHPEARGDDAACLLEVGEGRLLLTADLRDPTGLAITSPVEVLQVPAHASPRGADLTALRPRWAVASHGGGNRYAAARSQVASRYRSGGAKWRDTAHHGRLFFIFPAGNPARPQTGIAFAPIRPLN